MASRYQKMLADGPAPEEDEDKSSDNEPIKMGKISKAKKKKDRMHMRRKMPGYKLDKKEKLEKKEKKVKKEKKIKKDKKKHNSEKSHKSSCALDADCGDGMLSHYNASWNSKGYVPQYIVADTPSQFKYFQIF